MKIAYPLLNHPFYQAWTKGEIQLTQLSNYGHAYLEFINRIPFYWNKIVNSWEITDSASKQIINDELRHIDLWKKWISKLPALAVYSSMKEILIEFDRMTVSELLGAITSFEIQQPEIAKTKKSGLLNHYGFREEELTYFDEHMNEEDHIKFGAFIKQNFAKVDEYEAGFKHGAKILYFGLDRFIEKS